MQTIINNKIKAINMSSIKNSMNCFSVDILPTLSKGYTGKIMLHCKDGQVLQYELTSMHKVKKNDS